ncbi:hypothetical protein D3C72_1670050 [compost metagenome]
MVEVGVCQALRINGMRIMGKLAGCSCGRVHHGHHRVHGEDTGDLRPLKGLHQWLGQGQPTGLDQQHINIGAALSQGLHHRKELFLHGAAHAAVGQFVDLALGCVGAAFVLATDGTGPEDFAVNTQLAELVDDDCHAQALGLFKDMAHQRGLAAAQKAGDDGGGNLGGLHGVNS